MKIQASSNKFKQVDRHSLLPHEVGPQSRTKVYTCHEVLFFFIEKTVQGETEPY